MSEYEHVGEAVLNVGGSPKFGAGIGLRRLDEGGPDSTAVVVTIPFSKYNIARDVANDLIGGLYRTEDTEPDGPGEEDGEWAEGFEDRLPPNGPTGWHALAGGDPEVTEGENPDTEWLIDEPDDVVEYSGPEGYALGELEEMFPELLDDSELPGADAVDRLVQWHAELKRRLS